MADVGIITAQDMAYAAGFFDGEGCVQLYMRTSGRTKNCLRCGLSASGTDSRPLEWLQEKWGGTISWDARKKRIESGRRPVGRWIIFSNGAEVFAQDIQPYLIVKREQVDLWLEARSLLQKKGWGPAITEVERTERQRLVDLIKDLKTRPGRAEPSRM